MSGVDAGLGFDLYPLLLTYQLSNKTLLVVQTFMLQLACKRVMRI